MKDIVFTMEQNVPLVVQIAYTDFKSANADGKIKTSAICKQCKRKITGVGSTTSNYVEHLKTKVHDKL